jgi:hypothetical protein
VREARDHRQSEFSEKPTADAEAVPFDELSLRYGDVVYGVHELPVTW